jgi:DNA-binding ferritin-like protein
MSNYLREATDDAAETVRNFADEILEKLLDKGEASDDLFNDYPNGDSWHHECHVDKDYSLQEAAELLDDLCDHEETDSGLWEGLEPRRAIACQAAYTYGNAVYSEWHDLIEKINSEADDIIDDYNEKITEAEKREWDEDATEEEIEENPDVATLEEEKKEALQKMIAEVADNA